MQFASRTASYGPPEPYPVPASADSATDSIAKSTESVDFMSVTWLLADTTTDVNRETCQPAHVVRINEGK